MEEIAIAADVLPMLVSAGIQCEIYFVILMVLHYQKWIIATW